MEAGNRRMRGKMTIDGGGGELTRGYQALVHELFEYGFDRESGPVLLGGQDRLRDIGGNGARGAFVGSILGLERLDTPLAIGVEPIEESAFGDSGTVGAGDSVAALRQGSNALGELSVAQLRADQLADNRVAEQCDVLTKLLVHDDLLCVQVWLKHA